MRFHCSTRLSFFYLLFFFTNFIGGETVFAQADDIHSDMVVPKHAEPTVRVLLTFCEQSGVTGVNVSMPSGVQFIDAQNPQRKIALATDSLDIQIHDGSVFINNKRLVVPRVFIKSSDNTFTYNGMQYSGFLLCVQENGRIYIINCVGLEEYVAGVLSAESWPGWPLEANKVLATAIRTYVAAMVTESKKINRLYHIKNTNSHQVYRGMALSSGIKDAVKETCGQVIVDKNKKPILAMYDTCCGGIIPAHVRGIDFGKAPYLARKKACTFCASCKRYAWSVTYNKDTLCAALKTVFPRIRRLREIKVHTRDKAGLVTAVYIKETRGVHTVSGKRICSLLKGVKSCCFSITTHGGKIIFEGRGVGHQMGLCQWGAYNMIQKGWSVERVLRFYYPGTETRKLIYA